MSTTLTGTDATPRRRGRPILGAIAGLFLGLFVWLDLVLLDVIAFESAAFWVFPVLGLAAGVALAFWAPLGRDSTADTTVSPTPPSDEPRAPLPPPAVSDADISDRDVSDDVPGD